VTNICKLFKPQKVKNCCRREEDDEIFIVDVKKRASANLDRIDESMELNDTTADEFYKMVFDGISEQEISKAAEIGMEIENFILKLLFYSKLELN